MMLRKSLCMASVAVALFLAGSASALDYVWQGGSGDWNDPNHWNQAAVPPSDPANNVIISFDANGPYTVTIPVGYTADIGQNGAHPPYGTMYGPEWNATLDIYGALLYDWVVGPVGDAVNTPVINMYDGSYLNGVNLALGQNWWWNGGPRVTMNMSGTAYALVEALHWGGHLNLTDDSIMDVTVAVYADTVDQVSDATRLIDIASTTAWLVLPSGYEATVDDWIARDIIRGLGGAGNVAYDDELNPGRLTVFAIVPEPSTMALLGLGGLAGAFFLRRRSV